jgi:hypothetical protein
MLEREEYVEQAHFFRALAERSDQNIPMQELLVALKEEVLATTKLPMAIDFMLSELLHVGATSTAMARLGHYFTSFQTYVMAEAENDRGQFDMRTGLEVLACEAGYRAEKATLQGIFFYQFETLCRNRLRYDQGLEAIARDPAYDAEWRSWVLTVRRQIGIIDFADMIYVRSQHYASQRGQGGTDSQGGAAVLFGLKEGKIALANRRKDPLLLFSALQRHLGYPAVPRPKRVGESVELIAQLARRVERLESRLKLLEEEQRGGIDLTRYYSAPPPESSHS